jgi:L-lactate dehydrogenase (cytochrome)/glycolate oxidase
MGNEWFETVAEAERRAQRRIPKSVYMALVAGSEFGLTVKDNVEAFGELGFAPHVAGLSSSRDLSTTVMGQDLSLPVMISPTGVQAVHPDGEVAVARAAAARGTAIGLSSFAASRSRTSWRQTRRRSSSSTGQAPRSVWRNGSRAPRRPGQWD